MTIRHHFHAASWQEPLITELGSPGQRGVIVPGFDGPSAAPLAAGTRRETPPLLPEMGQPQVLKHFMRLSQMSLGHNVAIDLTAATTTPKYAPVINEALVRSPKIADLHPDQPLESVQGLLELMWELGECLKALTGMAEVAVLGQGGAHGIYANMLIMRAYHDSRGDARRDEVICPVESHPANAAAAHAAGFSVIEIPLGPDGYLDIEALQAAVSDRTAGFVMNNPVDSGLYNVNVDQLAHIVHSVGGLCAYDQANANATLGLARARDAGFDLCQLNLHKTLGAPMNLFGPAASAIAVTSELAAFLPTPWVSRCGDAFELVFDRPQTVGQLRPYAGNVTAMVKSLAWIRALGEDGLRDVARTAVLNNNYVNAGMVQLRGIGQAFPENTQHRLDLVRYSLEELAEATGIGAESVNNRLPDYGLPAAWMSHHPVTSNEPLTLEPTESFSKEELDEVIEVFAQIVDEAYTSPDTIASAPHRSMVSQIDATRLEGGFPVAATARALRDALAREAS